MAEVFAIVWVRFLWRLLTKMNASPGQNDAEPAVSLNGIRANVSKVHVDGVGRTKESLIMDTLSTIFHVKHFEQLVLESQEVKSRLLGMILLFRKML